MARLRRGHDHRSHVHVVRRQEAGSEEQEEQAPIPADAGYFAREGETVFDVGFGRGLLAAQLIKDRGGKRYYGIDIVDRYVGIATDLFHVKGLASDTLNLEVGDLYQLTRQRIEMTGAKLVICCEVLEHVPDAELALKTLAEALPAGGDGASYTTGVGAALRPP